MLLVGNFGVGNLGDEELKRYFIQRYPHVHWRVICARPQASKELCRLPCGIRSFFAFSWIATIKAYWNCDGVVFGGGSLFTDIESPKACLLWWIHAVPAYIFRKPIHLAFQGIGPWKTSIGIYLSTSVCRMATSISVRDISSFERVKNMQLHKKCVLSCDPVYWLIKKEKTDCSSQNVLILIPRNNSSDKFIIAMENAYKSNTWSAIRVISMKPYDNSESEFCQMIIDKYYKSAKLLKITSLGEILQNIKDSGLVVSERYHGALAALTLGKPVEIITQSDDDKLCSLQGVDILQWDSLLSAGEELLGL